MPAAPQTATPARRRITAPESPNDAGPPRRSGRARVAVVEAAERRGGAGPSPSVCLVFGRDSSFRASTMSRSSGTTYLPQLDLVRDRAFRFPHCVLVLVDLPVHRAHHEATRPDGNVDGELPVLHARRVDPGAPGRCFGPFRRGRGHGAGSVAFLDQRQSKVGTGGGGRHGLLREL